MQRAKRLICASNLQVSMRHTVRNSRQGKTSQIACLSCKRNKLVEYRYALLSSKPRRIITLWLSFMSTSGFGDGPYLTAGSKQEEIIKERTRAHAPILLSLESRR